MANEKRLIDANALLEYFQFRLPIDNQNAEVIDGCVKIARRTIENAPTVDAVEVVHAEWVDAYGIRNSKCTNCGVAFGRVMNGDCYYCPNCGANMDGGNEVCV